MRTKIDSLTGFRAFASFLVFFHHLPPDWPGYAGEAFKQFCREGHIGVTLFFVLSGFLITRNYAENFKPTWGWFYRYMRNRFARIYPLYFILTVLTFELNRQFYPPLWWMNLTMVRGYFEDFLFSGVGQGWSLTVEESFYLTAPLLFFFKPKTWWMPTLILYAIGSVLILLNREFVFVYGFMANFHFVEVYVYFGRALEFMIGAHLAFYLANPNLKSIFRFAEKWQKTWIGLASNVATMVTFALIKSPYPGYGNFGLHVPAGTFINNCVLPWFLALMIWGLATEKTWLQKIFSSPPAIVLGHSSYALYLIHMGVVPMVIHYYTHWEFTTAVSFAVLVPVSILLYYTVEKPLQWLLRSPSVVARPDKAPPLAV